MADYSGLLSECVKDDRVQRAKPTPWQKWWARHWRRRDRFTWASLLFLRTYLAIERLGFLHTDQAVVVRVDAVELLVGAEKLPARHVAVAVEVHLAEPERARCDIGPVCLIHAIGIE